LAVNLTAILHSQAYLEFTGTWVQFVISLF
jgi:hypothetical protein